MASKTRRTVMKEFCITEISGVDRPAQQMARVAIMKRDDGDAEFNKACALTTEAMGHQHSFSTTNYGGGEVRSGDTGYATSPGEEHSHSHPWVMTSDGRVVLGVMNGHTHEVDTSTSDVMGYFKAKYDAAARQKMATNGEAMSDGSFPIADTMDLENAIRAFGRANEADRGKVAQHIRTRAKALGATDKIPTDGVLAGYLKAYEETSDMPDDTTKINQDLEKRAKRAEAIVGLSKGHREYFDTLDTAGQDSFLAKSDTERSAAVANALDTNPIVFKSAKGVEYRKNDDPRLVEQAREIDEQSRELAKANAIARHSALEKRATSDLSHLAGTVETRVALLKAVDSIEDQASRDAVMEVLKSKNASNRTLFKAKGSSGGADDDNDGDAPAGDALDQLAQKYAKEKGVDINKAYDAVLATLEGAELYAKMVS